MALEVFPQLVLPHNRVYKEGQGFITRQEGQVNCGAAGGAGQANWGHQQDHLISHHEFRGRAGNPGYWVRLRDGSRRWIATGLSTTGIAEALQSYGCDAKRYGGSDIWIALDALKAGHSVGFAVDYAVINDYLNGTYSGDRRFDGPHFMVLGGYKADGQRNMNQDWDSLLDGRHKTAYTIMKAPQWVSFRMVRLAAASFRVGGTPVGKDRGIFVVVKHP